MARDLDRVVSDVFGNLNRYHHSIYPWRNSGSTQPITRRFMEIPIDTEVFEIPTFALKEFCDLCADHRSDLTTQNLIATLQYTGKEANYKTLDRYMRDMILEDFKRSRLVRLPVKNGSEEIFYYGTHGAVFDKNLKPMMMCLWQLSRGVTADGNGIVYSFIKPILRVDPGCYCDQSDSMLRWITKKMINTCLSANVFEINTLSPSANAFTTSIISRSNPRRLCDVIVEICKCPFKIRTADVPSVSTTNESLIQLAIDHIDEILT